MFTKLGEKHKACLCRWEGKQLTLTMGTSSYLRQATGSHTEWNV